MAQFLAICIMNMTWRNRGFGLVFPLGADALLARLLTSLIIRKDTTLNWLEETGRRYLGLGRFRGAICR